jgi:hypothetical protein
MSRVVPFVVSFVGWSLIAVAGARAQQAASPSAKGVHGRVETHAGLTVLRVWGTPEQRGFAHGLLLGKEIAETAKTEFKVRFARQKPMLEIARGAIGRMVAYPDDVKAEIEAVFAGLVASGADLAMPELGRPFDVKDLMVANALDVFGVMACSGFAVWGEQVEGGGVLSGRNFDWPFSGRHLLDHTILIVQHMPGGAATASVAWPGYVGTVTGVSKAGAAVYLHVGTGKFTATPEPDSWPTAVAARLVLEQIDAGDSKAAFAKAGELLGFTSPPAGYLTHLVLPNVGAASPAAVFETDSKKSVCAPKAGSSVVTNHFAERKDGVEPSPDSTERERDVRVCLDECRTAGDHKVSIAEAWATLQKVDRSGIGFGTLHSLVFRAEPWCFELRVATVGKDGVVAATRGERAHVLTRADVFPAEVPAGPVGDGK